MHLPSNALITRQVTGPDTRVLEVVYRPHQTSETDYWGVVKLNGQEVQRLFGSMIGIATPESEARTRSNCVFAWRVTTDEDLQEIAEAWHDAQAIEAMLKGLEMAHWRLDIEDRRRIGRIFGGKLAAATVVA